MTKQFIITNHSELRTRKSIDCSSPKLTDQSFKNQCDVNIIMENYAKTGMLSHVTTITPTFTDNTLVPSLEDAFNIVNRAEEAFSELPPAIRKLMDNNPSNLELFIQNPDNQEILVKHGVLVEKTQVIQTPDEKHGTGGSDAKTI